MKTAGFATAVALTTMAMVTQAVAAVDPASWTPVWATAPTAPIRGVLARVIPEPPSLQGTIRYRVTVSAGGRRLALRLSNEAGSDPLVVGRVTVATLGAPSRVVPVSFGASAAFEIPAGAPALSDPIDLAVAAGEQVIVSVFLPRSYLATQSQAANRAEYFPDVDRTNEPGAPGATAVSVRPIVSAVLAAGERRRQAIVAFGDSTTDGAGGRLPSVRGWPDVLATRLRASRVGDSLTVANAGISGNRLFGTSPWGISALSRLDRDVLSLPNVGYVVLLEGVNDIGGLGDAPGAPETTAQQMIAAYRQIIARSRQHGVKVIGGTIPPFGASRYSTPSKEAVRQEVNAWIRTSGAFDGVVDFDAAVRDPQQPDRLQPAYDSGDHLHPSDAGYRAMGEAVDLDLFRRSN